LQADVNCSLRRGAWYRVRQVNDLEAILEVNRGMQRVPSFLLQVVSTPPRRWTVVRRPKGATRLAALLGPRYVVCPSCRERTPLRTTAEPRMLDCDRCRGEFEVAWNEGYLAD
jgi:hypothetical protein